MHATTVAANCAEGTRNVLYGHMVEFIFNTLFKTKDRSMAIKTIMELVGNEFDVSRIYIIEEVTDQEYCTNVYSWCNKNADSAIKPMQRIKKGVCRGYEHMFNDEGILYCNNIATMPKEHYQILQEQNVHSMLQCSIVKGGMLIGVVGFDVCSGTRYWT